MSLLSDKGIEDCDSAKLWDIVRGSASELSSIEAGKGIDEAMLSSGNWLYALGETSSILFKDDLSTSS